MISVSETFEIIGHQGELSLRRCQPSSRIVETPIIPHCCKKGDREILRFDEARAAYGPVRPGWAININQGGEPAFENINFCPWCGRRLPDSY